MNWKKFLIETTVVGVATTAGLLYAPAFLAAEAGAVILGAKVGIGALGVWGLTKAWKDLWNEAPQKTVVVQTEVQPQQQNKTQQKEHQREQHIQKRERSPRRWIKAPRLLSKWRTKTGRVENTNYRDAA